ncbi:unnamed protein product [Closterium sp. NIES-65]|nr:unnamed protein product [Closterium sp. NIES-65]
MDQSKRGPRAGDAEVVDTASIPAGIASGAAERNSEKGGMAERDAEGGERAEKAERAAEKGAEAAGGGIGAADELRARVGRRMAKKIKKVVAAGKGDAKHYYDVYGAQVGARWGGGGGGGGAGEERGGGEGQGARAELELRPPVSKGAEQRAKPLSFTVTLIQAAGIKGGGAAGAGKYFFPLLFPHFRLSPFPAFSHSPISPLSPIFPLSPPPSSPALAEQAAGIKGGGAAGARNRCPYLPLPPRPLPEPAPLLRRQISAVEGCEPPFPHPPIPSSPHPPIHPAATVSDTMKAMFARPVALKKSTSSSPAKSAAATSAHADSRAGAGVTNGPPLPPEHYLLTWRQLKENNFPLPVVAGNKGRDGQDGKEAARKAGGSISLADGSAVPPPGQIAIFPGQIVTFPGHVSGRDAGGRGGKAGRREVRGGKEQQRGYHRLRRLKTREDHRLVAVDCEMVSAMHGGMQTWVGWGKKEVGVSQRGGQSEGGSVRGGVSQRGGQSEGGVSQRGGQSEGGSVRGVGSVKGGGQSEGGSVRGGVSQRGGQSEGGSVRGGVSQRGGQSEGGSVRGGVSQRGGQSEGGSVRGGVSQRGGQSEGGSVRGGSVRGGVSQRGGQSEGGSVRGGVSQRGGQSEGGVSQRGGQSEGGSVRGGVSQRGGQSEGGSCNTRKGLELTRLTLLDAHGKVLLDELVKPDSPITNYNTQFSGITPQMLAGVTTTLQQAQEHFLGIVSAETILVGHSTESDLHAIRAVHLRVIDTSLLFPHPRGPPFKCALRFLAVDYLGRTIQAGWWGGQGGEGRAGRGRRGGMRGGLRGGWSFHRGRGGAASGGADGAASAAAAAATVAASAVAGGVGDGAAGAARGYRRSNTWCRNDQNSVAAAPPATAAGGVGGEGEAAANGGQHEAVRGSTGGPHFGLP